MHFEKNLQLLRKMTNMTQETLAEKMKVSRQTVSKWESGSILPEVEKLIDLCKIFHCSLDQLLQGNMDYSSEAYSEIKIVTVEPFCYIQYPVISRNPEEDAITHVKNWAKHLKMENPHIIGWDFPQVSQEQVNVFHMHGYAAALILDDAGNRNDIDTEILKQNRQKYLTITLREKAGEEFTLIPNAYKALFSYMAINDLKQKHDPAVIPCYEYEYSDRDGVEYMDIFIAIS